MEVGEGEGEAESVGVGPRVGVGPGVGVDVGVDVDTGVAVVVGVANGELGGVDVGSGESKKTRRDLEIAATASHPSEY